MKMTTKSGTAIAMAAAMLIGSVGTIQTASARARVGHCLGANACKGLSACKNANNACKGLNVCKGKGFALLTKGKCSRVGGTYEKA